MFKDMYMRLQGSVPKIPLDLCKTLVNDAWRDVRRKNLWSFNLWEGNWTTPAIITQGSAMVTLGSPTVVLDAIGSAALLSQLLVPTPLTQRQFRVGIGTIYNIWGVSIGAGNLVTLTLDRPYAELAANPAFYNIFQCYYPAPIPDFLSFISVRDMTNFISLNLTKNRQWLNQQDPQRTWYYFSTYVIPYQVDQNPSSPTVGYPLFELWGAPQSVLSYQLYGLRRGLPLVRDTDTLPRSVGEDCVLALARMYAYEWAEANRGDNTGGSDFRFLMGAARKEYDELFKSYRKDDRELIDNYFIWCRNPTTYGAFWGMYNSINQTANPGGGIGW